MDLSQELGVSRQTIRLALRLARQLLGRVQVALHILGPSVIDVTGDSAEARCGYVAYGRIGDDPWQVMTIGRIYWSLARNGNGWLFTKVDNRAIGRSAGAATSVHTKTL